MTAVIEAGTHETRTLEHRENCLCYKSWRAEPAVMVDERAWVFSLLQQAVLEILDRDLVERGHAPLLRTRRERYNAAGERIGPDLQIRRCDALLYSEAYERALVAIEKTADRQR